MAQNAIGDSANIFLKGSELYQNANSRIFDAISQMGEMYQRQQMQKEANLAAERQKQMEIEAQKAKMLYEQSQNPEFILAKAIQAGPEALSPQERALFEANQRMESSKVALNALGQPYNPYQAIDLSTIGGRSKSASPMGQMMDMGQPVAPVSSSGMLAPPRVDGGASTFDQFNASVGTDKLPAPIGAGKEKPYKNLDTTGVRSTDTGKLEEFKSDLDVNKTLAIEEGKSAIEQEKTRRQAMFATNKQFSGLLGDFDNISKKVDKAISQSNFLNTGALAGEQGTGEARKTTGKGILGSGFVTGGVDLQNTLKTLEADSAFSALQNMRDNSPTGGALGGIAVRELELLGAAKQSLEQSQSAKQLDENLKSYKEVRKGAIRNVAEAYKQQYGEYPKGYDPKRFTPIMSDADVQKFKSAGYTDAQIKEYKRQKGLQ